MIRRKIITTLVATPISLMFIFAVFFGEWKQPLELVVMTGMFSLILSPFILFYGVPVTFLTDHVGKRFNGYFRVLIAFTIHLMFGILFGFIVPLNMSFPFFGAEVDLAIISASITSFLFWTIDELIRKNNKKIVSCWFCYSFAK